MQFPTKLSHSDELSLMLLTSFPLRINQQRRELSDHNQINLAVASSACFITALVWVNKPIPCLGANTFPLLAPWGTSEIFALVIGDLYDFLLLMPQSSTSMCVFSLPIFSPVRPMSPCLPATDFTGGWWIRSIPRILWPGNVSSVSHFDSNSERRVLKRISAARREELVRHQSNDGVLILSDAVWVLTQMFSTADHCSAVDSLHLERNMSFSVTFKMNGTFPFWVNYTTAVLDTLRTFGLFRGHTAPFLHFTTSLMEINPTWYNIRIRNTFLIRGHVFK